MHFSSTGEGEQEKDGLASDSKSSVHTIVNLYSLSQPYMFGKASCICNRGGKGRKEREGWEGWKRKSIQSCSK